MKSQYPIHLERSLSRIWAAYIERFFQVMLQLVRKQYEKDLPVDPQQQVAADSLNEDLIAFINTIDGTDHAATGAVVDIEGTKVSKSMVQSIRRTMREIDTWSFDTTKAAVQRIDVRKGTELAVDVFRETPALNNILRSRAVENAKLIKGLQTTQAKKIAGAVRQSLTKGTSLKKLEARLRKIGNVDKNKARFWAVDQLGTLNADLNEERHKGAGFPGYIWWTSLDNRVRDTHAERHGNFYEYGKTDTDPGRPYRCRCHAEPAFGPEDAQTEMQKARDLNIMKRERRAFGQPTEALNDLIVSAKPTNLISFKAVPSSNLSALKTIELREMAKERGIKYFRVMNKEELQVVLTNPDRVEEIAMIAKARWQKLPVPNPKGAITSLEVELNRKSVRALQMEANKKGIKNFRVMNKEQLVRVLSDPSEYDKVQRELKVKLAAAGRVRGRKVGTTKFDDLKLSREAAKREESINNILDRVSANGRRSGGKLRTEFKEYLNELTTKQVQTAEKFLQEIRDYDTWKDAVLDLGLSDTKEFTGLYFDQKMVIVGSKMRRDTFTHEFAHFLDDMFGVTSISKGKASRKLRDAVDVAFERSRERALKKLKKLSPRVYKDITNTVDVDWKDEQVYGAFFKWRAEEAKIISGYSLYDRGEYWAESVMYYMEKGNWLIRQEPGLYKLLKEEIFDGKEFL